jgi:hypothetical protein
VHEVGRVRGDVAGPVVGPEPPAAESFGHPGQVVADGPGVAGPISDQPEGVKGRTLCAVRAFEVHQPSGGSGRSDLSASVFRWAASQAA